MPSHFNPHCVPKYRLLTDEQIKAFHRATLDILETVGVRVLHTEALRMLRDAGCRIIKDDTVQIPNGLVEQCIQSAPSGITLFNRQGNEAMHLEGNQVHFGLGTDLLQTYDLETSELRPSCLKDVADAAIVADYFDEIDFIASHAFPNEVPGNLAFIAEFKALIENSVKPIYFTSAGAEDLQFILKMAAAASGSADRLREKPFLIHYAEPVSPLVHSRGALNKLLLCADRGIPLNYVPALMAGGTGPVTMAGSIAVANAEALSGLVIHQLRAKGAPMISGFSVTPLDMRTGNTVYGSPEERLTHTACTQLYHFYGIPVWGEAGCSDSKAIDQQAAMESAFQILMGALEGCNLIHDVGYLGQGLIGSPASIVMCSEMISYVKRILRGFEMNPESLAVDLIREVGPGGNFLAEPHTLEFMRKEHWVPRFINRDNPEVWDSRGRPEYLEVITQKAKDVLHNHRPLPLSDEAVKQIEKIYRQAEDALTDRFLSA